ncbi:MAG: AI-2E family transporter [Clostridiaceae bacterium]|nr:AI-2E family transporter [Clostridiaceae bacterium]
MQRSKKTITIIAVILIVLIAVFLYNYRSNIFRILSPIFHAFVITYLVKPLVKKLQNKNIPCSVSIILVYFFIVLSAGAIIIYILPGLIESTKDLINTIPDIVSYYQEKFNSILKNIQKSNWSPDIKNAIFNQINDSALFIEDFAIKSLKVFTSHFISSLRIFVDFILGLVIAFYFIKDTEYFKSILISLIPKRWRKYALQTGQDVNLIITSFIQGQLLTAIIVGILEFVGLFLLKVKYSMVLGIIGGIFEIIPYFGPIIGAIPAVAVALLDSPVKAIWTVLLFITAQQIENVLISPKIMQSKIGLHPVATLITVLAGGEFLGIIGMIISVPLVAIVKTVFKRTIEELV